MLQTLKPITTVFLCFLLIACGGGGGSDGTTTAAKEGTGSAGLSQSGSLNGTSSNSTATGSATIPSGDASSNSNPSGNTGGNASTSPSAITPSSGSGTSLPTSGSGSNSGSPGSTTPAQPVARLIVPYSAFNNTNVNGNVAGSENGLLFVAGGHIINYVDQQRTTGTAVPVIPPELFFQYHCARRVHVDGPYPCFENAAQIELDVAGNLYVTDWGLIRKVTPDRGATTVARFYPSNGSEPSPRVSLSNVAFDSAGNVYVAVNYSETSADYPGRTFIRKIAPDGTISDAIPNFTFNKVSAIRIDSAQNMYINEGGRILKRSPDGVMTVVADLVPTDPAKRFFHSGLALDSKGNIYVNQMVYSTDNSVVGMLEYRIVKVTSSGTASNFMENKLIAGNLIGPDILPVNDLKSSPNEGLNNLYAVTLP